MNRRKYFIVLLISIPLILGGFKLIQHSHKCDNDNLGIAPVLRYEIENYIRKFDNSFLNKEWIYYSIFFETDSTETYFTIWSFTIFPTYVNNCIQESSYHYFLFNVLNRKVVIIDRKDHNNPLFQKDSISVAEANNEIKKAYSGDIYDGSWNIVTYKVTNNISGTHIVKADTTISYFLNCNEFEVIDEDIIIPE